ncbi:MAG TPA: metallophosphoesterase, partial [Desulfosporosinus sp.]|nr:metallophosphoesterase [Desulfosporosinus sp.]
MSLYIGRRGWYSLGQSTKLSYRAVYWLFFGLLILWFPLLEIAQDYLPITPGLWFTISGWYSMIAVVYLFLLLVVIDIVRLLDRRMRFVPVAIKDHQKTPKVFASVILVFVTLTLIYGSWNARHPVIVNYELTVDKESQLDQLRIAMVSDIHYGDIIDVSRLKGMVEAIEELQPDLILLAGDITDGMVTKEKAQKLIAVLEKMQAKYGIYAVPGNHDRWARNDSDILRSFNEAGINVLRDSFIKVDNGFYIIGRDDPSNSRERGRKELGGLMQGVDASLPIILLDHQPIDIEISEKNQIDLQLSGHTHRGQIFPGQLITNQLYDSHWGLLTRGSYHLIVSSGYGTWGPPLRIGTHPEVVNVTIKFKDRI